MKESTAIRLTHLFDAGYLIQINDSPYVAGNITSIGREDYDDDNSPYVYSDELQTDRPLSEVIINDVQVYKPIHIFNEDINDTCLGDYEGIDYSNFEEPDEEEEEFPEGHG